MVIWLAKYQDLVVGSDHSAQLRAAELCIFISA